LVLYNKYLKILIRGCTVNFCKIIIANKKWTLTINLGHEFIYSLGCRIQQKLTMAITGKMLSKLSSKIEPFNLSDLKEEAFFQFDPWGGRNMGAQQTQKKRINTLELLKKVKPTVDDGGVWDSNLRKDLKNSNSFFVRHAAREAAKKGQSGVLDFPSLPASSGKIPAADEAKAVITEEQNLFISWSYNKFKSRGNAKDNALIIAYSPKLDDAVWKIKGPLRKDKGYILELPDHFSGQIIETYLAFTNGDRSSDSMFLGQFRIG
jgi:hypothetical protein